MYWCALKKWEGQTGNFHIYFKRPCFAMLDKLRSNFNGGFFFLGLVNGLKIRDDKIKALQLRV